MEQAKRWKIIEKQRVVVEEFEFDARALQPHEVAVRTVATAISAGTECANYLALDPDVYAATGWCRYPWVPGYTGVGDIIATGTAVREFVVGDVVAAALRHASHQIVDTRGPVVKVPAGLPPEQAAFGKLIGIGMTALQVVKLEPLATVGVWGLGMIGNFAAQVFQQAGGRVVGMDPVPQRRELAGRCGLRHTFDPQDGKFVEKLMAFCDGEGLDVMVESTGHAPTAIAIAQHARLRGQYVFLTHWRNQPPADATALVHALFWKSLTVYGAHEAFVEAELGGRDRWVTVQRRKWRRIFAAIAAGELVVAPLISHVIQPSQAREAYEGLCFQKDKWWGVAVDWS